MGSRHPRTATVRYTYTHQQNQQQHCDVTMETSNNTIVAYYQTLINDINYIDINDRYQSNFLIYLNGNQQRKVQSGWIQWVKFGQTQSMKIT